MHPVTCEATQSVSVSKSLFHYCFMFLGSSVKIPRRELDENIKQKKNSESE